MPVTFFFEVFVKMTDGLFEHNLQRFVNFLDRTKEDLFIEYATLKAEIAVTDDPVPWDQRKTLKYRPIAEGDHWGTIWQSAWIHLTGTVPKEWEGRPIALRLNVGGEALLFEDDGTPHWSFTDHSIFSEHFRKEFYRFDHPAKGGEELDLWVDAASTNLFGTAMAGEPHPTRYTTPEGTVNPVISHLRIALFNEELYHYRIEFENLRRQLANYYKPSDYRAKRLMAILNRACDVYREDPSRASLARAELKPALECKASGSVLNVTAVGHAHIDVAATNLNYTIYKTLNVDLNSGSNHTLAIDSAKYSLQVTTSNQLAFCLEHGAKPIFTSTTCSAYRCYQSAIAVLNQICDNTMSDYDKALAIYTWIIDNVQYDYNAVTYGDDNSYGYNLKTNYWMYYDAYYLEGVFALNGTRVAVCDGMAKAYTLMCQMEGINCVRVTGSVSSGSTSGGHAWNRVYLDGKWYILDTTWGGASNASKKSLLNEECPTGESVNYSYFLVAENDSLLNSRSIYSNGNWRATGNLDYFTTSKFYVDVDGDGTKEDYSFYITNVDQLTALFLYCILYTDSNGDYMGIDGYTIQFAYSGSVLDSMQDALTAAKAIADERAGFEKNFNTAFPFNYDTSEGTYTLVFTGTYVRATNP